MSYIEDLIQVYIKSQTTLVGIISNKSVKGSLHLYEKSLLQQVNNEIIRLNEASVKLASENIPKIYKIGVNKSVNDLNQIGVRNIQGFGSFSALHTGAIEVLVKEATNDLTNANFFVGRQIKDAVRSSNLDVISQKIATGRTVEQAKQLLTQRLIDEGLNGIRTKDGRTINLSSYASTVARSTSREATNIAMLNNLTYNNYDLVRMSEHGTTCPICGPLEGRIYSISGTNHRYPSLDMAFTGSHANIHPNCKHVLTPYIVEFAKNPEKDIEMSNENFNVDTRSQRQIDLYNKKQKERQQIYNDRDQWQRYKLALPDQTPKTFSGFISSKRSNSERFKNLQSDYRSIRRSK